MQAPRSGARFTSPPTRASSLIRRLRLADGEPMALETLHVPAALVPGLTRETLEDCVLLRPARASGTAS